MHNAQKGCGALDFYYQSKTNARVKFLDFKIRPSVAVDALVIIE